MKYFICIVCAVAAMAQIVFNASAAQSVCSDDILNICDAVSDGEYYFLAGSKNDDAAVVCFNSYNKIIWEAYFGGSKYDCFKAIAVKNNMVVAAGYSV